MTAKQRQARDARWRKLLREADAAGREAAEATKIIPSIIGTPKDLVGSLTGGDGGGFDTDQPIYVDTETGVCGFAWIRFPKATTAFARFLKRAGIGRHGGDYWGGWEISVRQYGQSLQKKENYAMAYAATLRAAGIDCHTRTYVD